jgi:hypothetical protein
MAAAATKKQMDRLKPALEKVGIKFDADNNGIVPLPIMQRVLGHEAFEEFLVAEAEAPAEPDGFKKILLDTWNNGIRGKIFCGCALLGAGVVISGAAQGAGVLAEAEWLKWWSWVARKLNL